MHYRVKVKGTNKLVAGLPRWLSGKEPACRARDAGPLSGSGRAPEEGSSYSRHYSCLGIPMDKKSLAG